MPPGSDSGWKLRSSKSASRSSPQRPFERERMGDDMSSAQADHTDAEPAELILLVGGDDVAVAVESESSKRRGPEDPTTSDAMGSR